MHEQPDGIRERGKLVFAELQLLQDHELAHCLGQHGQLATSQVEVPRHAECESEIVRVD